MRNGATPLQVATRMGHMLAVSCLRAHGVDANRRVGGVSALDLAIKFGHSLIACELQAAATTQESRQKRATLDRTSGCATHLPRFWIETAKRRSATPLRGVFRHRRRKAPRSGVFRLRPRAFRALVGFARRLPQWRSGSRWPRRSHRHSGASRSVGRRATRLAHRATRLPHCGRRRIPPPGHSRNPPHFTTESANEATADPSRMTGFLPRVCGPQRLGVRGLDSMIREVVFRNPLCLFLTFERHGVRSGVVCVKKIRSNVSLPCRPLDDRLHSPRLSCTHADSAAAAENEPQEDMGPRAESMALDVGTLLSRCTCQLPRSSRPSTHKHDRMFS